MEVSLDVSVANRFISSLSKSLQALCHGCMDFDSGIEIIGYINVNVDSGSKVDYVLNEKVQKSRDNSMTFVSNSFLAKKDKAKQLRDGVCSPVPELQKSFSFSGQSGNLSQSTYPPYYQSQVLRGAHKRQWSGRDREWRNSHRKYSRISHSATRQSFTNNPTQSSSMPFPNPQSLHPGALSQSEPSHSAADQSFANNLTQPLSVTLPSPQSLHPVAVSQYNVLPGSSNAGSAISIKKEDLDTESMPPEPGDNNMQGDAVSVKQDPDSVWTNNGETHGQSLANNFLQQSSENTQHLSFPDGTEAGDQGSFKTQPGDLTNSNYNDCESTPGLDPAYDNTLGGNSDLKTASFGDTGVDMSSYPESSFGEQGETSGDRENFECIEIDDDDEEEDFQAIFGDNQTSSVEQSLSTRMQRHSTEVYSQTSYSSGPCRSAIPVRTKAGKLGIKINGFRYTRDRESYQTGLIYWRCQFYRTCKARCKTDSNLVIISMSQDDHNHDPPLTGSRPSLFNTF